MGSWCCNKDGYWPVQFPSTHPTTVSASTWKSPAGSSSGQWCLYYFLFSLNCHPILNYILFSQQHHLSTPLLLYFFWSILAIPDHLLTLDLPRSATLPFFFFLLFFFISECSAIPSLPWQWEKLWSCFVPNVPSPRSHFWSQLSELKFVLYVAPASKLALSVT